MLNGYQILLGDCLSQLKTLVDGSINCCVTSPPYYGLRDYGMDEQIGLEETPELYIQKLVEVFREVRRVLRDDGTLWVNIGDSYAARQRQAGEQYAGDIANGSKGTIKNGSRKRPDGYKEKDLIGIPWMLAFALRADGWYLRQDIIWSKPNAMPESVRDRCTKSHEYVFLLSKSQKYYYDHEAIKEPAVSTQSSGNKTNKQRPNADALKRGAQAGAVPWEVAEKRNRRDVWSIPTRTYKGAHFATFPPALIEPCILAGCPAGGVTLDPFGGSGTSAGVSLAHGRKAVICELNPEYAGLIPDRINSIIASYQGGK